MEVKVTDFESGLGRARQIVRVAHLADDHRKLRQPHSNVVKSPGKMGFAMHGKMVRAVHSVVASHPESNAESLEHSLGGNQLAHRLPSFVARWPTSNERRSRVWKPSMYQTDIGVGGLLKNAESGPDAHILIGFDHYVRPGLDSFLPGQTHPVIGLGESSGAIEGIFKRGRLVEAVVHRDDGNLTDGGVSHEGRLADHSLQDELACPGCGQRFLDNGWSGFTPIHGDEYGTRTWNCPTCGTDMREIRNRPFKPGDIVPARKFEDPPGELSYSFRQSPRTTSFEWRKAVYGKVILRL